MARPAKKIAKQQAKQNKNIHEPQNNALPKAGFLKKRDEQIVNNHVFSTGQENALESLLQQGLGSAQNLPLPGDPLQSQIEPFNFAPIEQSARQNFAQNTVPSLAERFTSMGSGSALSSPAFSGQLGRAGAGLESEIARLSAEYGLQQQGLNLQQQGLNQNERGMQASNLQNLLGAGLAPRTDPMHLSGQQSGLVRFAKGVGNIGASLAGSYLSGGRGGGGGTVLGDQDQGFSQGRSSVGNVMPPMSAGFGQGGVGVQSNNLGYRSEPYSALQNTNNKSNFMPNYREYINLLSQQK
jgi:hypothetical protein